MENSSVRGKYDAAFCLGQDPSESSRVSQQTRWASRSIQVDPLKNPTEDVRAIASCKISSPNKILLRVTLDVKINN